MWVIKGKPTRGVKLPLPPPLATPRLGLKKIFKKDKLVLLSGDRDLCLVIIQRNDCDMKPQNITDDGIRQGIYSPAVDITLSDMT